MKNTLKLIALTFAAAGSFAVAAPVTYTIDPSHTYPSFEADHMGISAWGGKFNNTEGKVVLDKDAKTGLVQIDVDVASVNFGHAKMDEVARSPEIFDAAKYPKAHYEGTLIDFVDGKPTGVEGYLTLHGVTKPVELKLESFTCKTHPMLKREVCGGMAIGTFDRSAFGITAGEKYGFNMNVKLRIQVEAIAN